MPRQRDRDTHTDTNQLYCAHIRKVLTTNIFPPSSFLKFPKEATRLVTVKKITLQLGLTAEFAK
jgi:hypothetical protein